MQKIKQLTWRISPDPSQLVRNVLKAAAVATFAIGFTVLIDPVLVMAWFGDGGTANAHFVQYVGTALIGYSVINWLYSNAEDIRHALPGMYGNLASLGVATALDVVSIARQISRPSLWVILLIHVVFATLFIKCILLMRGRLIKG